MPNVKEIKGERTMKKIVILLVVLVMVFAFTIPAAAGGYGPGGGNGSAGTGPGVGQGQQGARGTFMMAGTIAALGTDTVTINVIHGNKLVQPYIGTQVTVTVTPQTRYLLKNGTTVTTIGFGDLKVGQKVSVYGIFANNVWTASRITVGASLNCLP
jgi:hypothetical protein